MTNQNDTTNPKLQQALHYREKLKWSVIPVGKDKKPLIKWEKYQKELPTPEQIIEWYQKNSQANIAVITGKLSGIMAIDIDPRNGGTDEDFKDIKTVRVKTGGGGYHYYFQYEGSIINQKSIKPGIDLKTEGGFVIAPPSIHESDNSYEWIVSPSEIEIVPLPQFVKDWINAVKPDSHNNISNWDTNKLNGVSEGSRNNVAASIAGKLLRSFKQEDWENVGWPLLQGWNLKNKPPLSENELRTTFESIAKREGLKSNRGTETPDGTSQPLISEPLLYKDVENKIKQFLPNSQTALKLVLAVAASCNFQSQVMLWLLFVGVPSSGKTDLVRLIKDADATYYLDNLTQNAFVSGERSSKSNKVYDLLPLIDKKCLIIKDWTSIFSLDEKMTKKLLGDLVGIYDKEFTKFSSRRGNISYSSAFSQLGCITPATLNRHTQYMNMVGPRFLCYTMPPTSFDDEIISYEIIFSNKDRSLIEKEARLYASSYLNQLTQRAFDIKPLSQEVKDYLRLAAELMADCRGIVLLQSASFKNEEGEDVKYYEVLDVQIEAPWRAIQQLIALSKYLAFVVGKDEVGIEELAIIKEVVISSMPADRSQALRTIKEHEGTITAKELADLSEKSTKTSRRLLDELVALKALEKIKGSGIIATDYKVTDQFRDFILLYPAEFMSRNQTSASGTETRDSMRLL